MQNFKKLKVWEKSHLLTVSVYKATKAFPKDELYGLTSQIRRASASIPSNIAEGCGRGSNADMARFMHIAAGSATETEYQLLLAKDLEYIDVTEYKELDQSIQEIKRMLTSLIHKLTTNN